MAYMNEYISQEDIEKYHLDELEKKHYIPTYAWTIDKERDRFLIHEGSGRSKESHMHFFFFYRQGEISQHTIWRFVDTLSKTVEWKIQRYGQPVFETTEQEQNYKQLLNDLKEAFRAYGPGGVEASELEDYENTIFINF